MQYRCPVSAQFCDDFFAGQRYEHTYECLRWREEIEALHVNVREGVMGAIFWTPTETRLENPSSRHISILWYQTC